MAEGKLMRKSKFGWLSVLVCGLVAVLLLALPVTAQDKGRFVPWERPKDWATLDPKVDYVPNTFVIGFNKPKIEPERLKGIVDLIQRVGENRKLQIENVSDQYFRGLENSTMPPAMVQVVRPEPKAAAVASVVGGNSIPNPNVCSNLVQYFRVSNAVGPELANLIDDLNAAIGSSFPDDVYILEPDTGGVPRQIPTPEWAKPAVATAADPVSASGVTVAVLDSGYNSMPGYTPAHSWNAVFKNANPKFTSTQLADITDNLTGPDARGHGTGVASIIRGPDMIGGSANKISMTNDVEIYPIKVCEDETCSSVSIAMGICRAISGIDGPVNVINLSLAGIVPSRLVKGAVKDALAANVTVVAAAGNIKTNLIRSSRWNETPGHYHFNLPLYPAAFSTGGGINQRRSDGIISVGAAQEAAVGGYEWAIFTPDAPRWFIPRHIAGSTLDPDPSLRVVTNLNRTIDLMAPGKNVLAIPNDGNFAVDNVVGGTSYAAPFVSGAAAILLGQHPTLTPAQLEKVMLDAARSNPVDCPPFMCGAGMLNVKGSLALLNDPTYRAANGITP
jgi:subtilisin family serine protease